MAGDVYQTQIIQYGINGLDLKRSLDLIPPTKLSRMVNVDRTEEGRLRLRKGQLVFAHAAGGLPVPKTNPVMDIDQPVNGIDIVIPFLSFGWAIDLAATPSDGVGMDYVDIWAFPGTLVSLDTANGSFLGRFNLGFPRPGVAAIFGAQFLNSGFQANLVGNVGVNTPELDVGPYVITIYAHSKVTGTFVTQVAREVQIVQILSTGVLVMAALDEAGLLQIPAVPEISSSLVTSEVFLVGTPEDTRSPDLIVAAGLKSMDVPSLTTWSPTALETTTFDDLGRLGVETVRLPFVEAPDGEVDLVLYDALVTMLTERGIGILGVVGPETLTSTTAWASETYRTAFARRVKSLAARYTDVTRWEVWPEPDAAATRLAPDDYALLLSAVAPGLSAATTVLGSIGPAGLQTGENYLSDLYASPAAQLHLAANGAFPWDRVSITPTLNDPDEDLDEPVNRARTVMRANGHAEMKMYLLLGWDARLVSEADQASYLTAAYTKVNTLGDPLALALGNVFSVFTWKRYQDTSLLFGLIDADGRRKPAYDAYFRLGASVVRLAATKTTATAIPDLLSPTATPASGPEVHSLFRLDDPRTGGFARLVGVGNTLYHGTTGPLPAIDGPYDGSPLHFAAMDPAISGQPWAYIANRSRMRKVRVDGLSLPIGLPAPSVPAAASLGAEQRTVIESFDSNAGWINADDVGPMGVTGDTQTVEGIVGGAVRFTTPNPGVDPDPFPPNNYAFWTKEKFLDLSKVGSRKATDDDLIHVRIRVDGIMERLIDLKIYIVVNANFVSGRFGLPGVGATHLVANTDAYVKSFRTHDFEGIVSHTSSPTEDVSKSAGQTEAQKDLDDGGELRLTDSTALVRQSYVDKTRGAAVELAPGRHGWSEFGVIDVALRRGDFLRIGGDSQRNWAHVTGLVVSLNVKSGIEGEGQADLAVSIDDMYLTGGYEIDNAEIGSGHYDWRYTNYDPRTGAESNGSPIMPEGSRIDTPRRKVNVNPAPFAGDANIRQRFYRRGGTLPSDWLFLGMNNGNGAAFEDTLGDAEIVASTPLDLDNDQPVTTVDIAGNTQRNQPLASIWGPVQDMLLGCGDRFRPGHLYWARPGEPDHWPPQNNIKVTSASEELMSGLVYGSDTYVFSRSRLYQLFPSLSGQTGTVDYQPTDCMHGLINRWAFTAGTLQGIFFVSDDGIYHTRGGAEVNISDEDIEGIFRGEERRGLPAVRPATARLALHENELWFLYRGAGEGAKPNVLIYDLLYRYWRQYDFLDGPTVALSERLQLSAPNLMVLGTHGGLVHKLEGSTDNAVAVQAHLRTGALDQGAPRRDKVYGDVAIDFSRIGGVLTLEPFINDEATSLGVFNIQGSLVKDRIVVDALKAVRARNLSLDLKWTSVELSLYFSTLQYLIDEGIERIRWDSEEIDHGAPGWSVPLYAHISIRAEADVTLSVLAYDQLGVVTTKTYVIPGSSGLKVRRFVPFQATKGILFKYVFTSSDTFKVYREESIVMVRFWGGNEQPVQPFGDALTVSPAEVGTVRGVGR